jgi:hypothetical protein
LTVCGEIVDCGGAPPCPGFATCRPPVCIPRRVITLRVSVIADRDIVYDVGRVCKGGHR